MPHEFPSLTTQIMEQSNVVIEVIDGKAKVIKDRFSSDFPRELTQEQLSAYLTDCKKVVVCNFKVR